MSIIDTKNFAGGGMDTDSAPELIAKNDYVSAYNIRTTGNSEGEEGYVVAIESNDPIPLDLPAGLNKCIGSARFEGFRRIYKFIYNSQLRHCITELDYDTNTETILYTNLDDSGGEDALILNPDTYIVDIKLLEDFLIFRNSDNEPCLINIQKLKNGEYGVITRDDFLLIKQQPYVSPTAELASDTSFSANFLRGKLFQFRYQFGYGDNETSVWSLMSDRPVPETEQNPNIGTVSTVNNAIIVGVNIGGNRVKNINIAVRQGNFDWSIVKEVSREYVLALGNLSIDIDLGVYEAYDSDTNTYYFTFYNNGLYQPIDVLETDLLYDYIPKECDSLEVINGRGDINSNGSVLTLGSTTEGYERPIVPVQLSVSAADSNIEYTNFTSTNPLRFNKNLTRAIKQPNQRFLGIRVAINQKRDCFVGLMGIPVVNDKITIYVTRKDGKTIVITAEHTVDSSDIGANINETMFNIAKKLAESLNNNNGNYIFGAVALKYNDSIPVIGGRVPAGQSVVKFTTVDRNDGEWYTTQFKPAVIELASIGTGNVSSVPSLKSNSSYQVALAYYDKWGRPFPIMTNQNMSLQTGSYAEYRGYVPYISWSINGAPPQGAASYQWLSSKNTTHLNTVYVDGYYKSDGDKGSFIEINLNTLNKYQENNPNTTVVYDFSPGDRVTFAYYLKEIESVLTPVWFDGVDEVRVDLEVLDYNIVVTEPTPGVKVTDYVLKLQKPSGVDLNDLENNIILLELYTPLNSTAQLENTVFFEIGERYQIVDGEHSVTSGSISGIDCYFKTREYNIPDPYGSFNLNGNKTFLVEDFNFSDFYASKYTSLGRPRTYFDTPENVKYPATIRYSYEFVSRSKINLINRFYGENLVTYDLKYGAIKKLFQRDNTLVCIQEAKVGYIPVSISIIEDQASQQNIATSTLLLNKIRYSDSGSIGIGNAVESFAQYSGDMFFVDPNRSEPVRVGYNGVQSIAGKMSKYFRRTLKEAVENGVKIIGYYNVFNREYIITTEQKSGVIVDLKFTESNWVDLEDFTVDTNTLSIETSPSKGNVTVNTSTGIAIYTPDLGESGNDSFSFSFTPEGEGDSVTKNVCINISEGNTEIPFFSLDEIFGQQLGVPSNSSVTVGPFENTAPVPISITSSGQYKINNGSWTNSPGYYYPGDTVVVRIATTSTEPLTTTSTTLTIGSQSAAFSATTRSADNNFYIESTDNILKSQLASLLGISETNIIGYSSNYNPSTLSYDVNCEINTTYSITSSTFPYLSGIRGYIKKISDEGNCISIGNFAFYSSTVISEISLPGLESIGNSSFGECSNLQSIGELFDLISIGDYAFTGCSSLLSIDAPNLETTGLSSFANCSSLETITLDSLESITNGLFQFSSSISSVSFANATSIGASAFFGCFSLVTVDIPNATSIGPSAFINCDSLESIELPSVLTAGNQVFRDCTILSSVILPAATSIGDFFFSQSNSMSNIELPVVENIGTTTGNNNVFLGISGRTITLTIPSDKNSDADVLFLEANNTVTIINP